MVWQIARPLECLQLEDQCWCLRLKHRRQQVLKPPHTLCRVVKPLLRQSQYQQRPQVCLLPEQVHSPHTCL